MKICQKRKIVLSISEQVLGSAPPCGASASLHSPSSNTSAVRRRWRMWRRAHERISKYIVWMFCWQKKRAKLKERKLLCVSLSGLSPSVSNKQTLLLYTLVYIIVLCCFIHEQIERLKNCIYSYHSDISGGWNFFLIVLLLERIELIT